MKKSLIQSIEQRVQTITAPYLFGKHQTKIADSAKEIGMLFSVNVYLLRQLHQLLSVSSEQTAERDPTWLARYIIWTRNWPSNLEEYYQAEVFQKDTSKIDRAWLNQQFTAWRDLWAGLQFADPDWLAKTHPDTHPLLGNLNGEDWLYILEAHTKHREKQLPELD
jgi:hypothetical protein